MTTAHRPTFDPAKGKNSQSSGTILHTRLLPAHTKLKYRQRGQGGLIDQLYGDHTEESDKTDLKSQLLQKEIEASNKKGIRPRQSLPQKVNGDDAESEDEDEDNNSHLFKRRKLLEIDPEDADDSSDNEDDSGGGGGGSNNDEEKYLTKKEGHDKFNSKNEKYDEDDEESNRSGSDSESKSEGEEDEESEDEDDYDDDSEDEAEILQRELQKIEQERAERLAREQEALRQEEIAHSNPLLNNGDTNNNNNNNNNNNHSNGGPQFKQKWYDDAIFQNQAKGIPVRPEDEAASKGFINDALRSDFHTKFMNKYIR